MNLLLIISGLFIAFLWALNTIIYKYGMTKEINYKTILVIGSFTYFIGMLGFALYHSKFIITDIQSINAKDIMIIVVGSFIGTFVATVLFMELLEKYDSSLVTALTYTTPMFVFIMGYFILDEDIDMLKLYGIFITIIGIILIGYNAPE